MKKEAYEVEYYEPKSVLAMQADRREEKHRRKQKKGLLERHRFTHDVGLD